MLNLELKIKNVHVRFEDNGNFIPNRAFSLGFFVESLQINQTDSSFSTDVFLGTYEK